MKKEMIMLGNLNCPTCAADLEKALKKMDGVKNASVTFATGALNLEYDAAKVKEATLDKAIRSFGVEVLSRA